MSHQPTEEEPYIPCAEKPPRNGMEPCCREIRHDGDHYWWFQAPWEEGEYAGTYGVTVMAGDGERLTTVANFEMKGKSTIEEVGVLMAVLDIQREKEKSRGG